MASNEDPEETLVSCPVCFIPFRQPKSLRCGHLLCTPCAQVILDQNQDGTIQCAICRRVSEERDLRRDFTMEENVLQFLKKQQVSDVTAEKKIENEVCQNCQKALQKSKAVVVLKTNGVVKEIQKFAELVAKKCLQLEEYATKEKAAGIKKTDVIEEHVARTLRDIQVHADFLQSILIENNNSTPLKPDLKEDLQSTYDRNIRCFDHAENEVIPAAEFNIHFNEPPNKVQSIEKLNVQRGANKNKESAPSHRDSSSNATLQQVIDLLEGWGPHAPFHHQLPLNHQPSGYWVPNSYRPLHSDQHMT